MNKKRITMSAIAAAAGVSQSTTGKPLTVVPSSITGITQNAEFTFTSAFRLRRITEAKEYKLAIADDVYNSFKKKLEDRISALSRHVFDLPRDNNRDIETFADYKASKQTNTPLNLITDKTEPTDDKIDDKSKSPSK